MLFYCQYDDDNNDDVELEWFNIFFSRPSLPYPPLLFLYLFIIIIHIKFKSAKKAVV